MSTEKKPKILLSIAYIIMLLVIFILPYFSAKGYNILKNTTSQLGAQNTPNAWIMNVTFILLALTAVIEGWMFLGNYWFHKIVLLIFGLALSMTAIFHHAPIDPAIEFDQRQDEFHSLFANITGFAFSLFAVATAFITKRTKQKIIAFAMGALAPLLSIAMFQADAHMGIWQRIIFISFFAWLVFAYNFYQLKEYGQ